MPQNPMCDNNKCLSSAGEVRVLPTGGGGNMIICHECYLHEMAFRRSENKRGVANEYKLPEWSSLKPYEGAG